MKKNEIRERFPGRESRSIPLLAIAGLLLLTMVTGCSKHQDDYRPGESNAAVSGAAGNGATEIPDIIVHAGGSIQAAVNAAKPGAVIHIEPGTYKETILVSTPGIKLTGLSNDNGDMVIIQNPGTKENGITVVKGADGFALKNVVIRNFTENGIKLDSINGFYIFKVTTINNGEYGIFPEFCSNGLVEQCTASGHADTGIYIGQSSSSVIRFNTAFDNVNGIEIENSTGIEVYSNDAHDNALGIFTDILPGKKVTTGANIIIRNNTVRNNNHKNFSPPGDLAAAVPSGLGILVLGPDNVTVEHNIVSGNNFSGITVFSVLVLGALAGIPPQAFSGIDPNPDNAQIIGNVLTGNGMHPPILPIPLPGTDLFWDGSGQNNCWKDNLFTTSYPSPLPACK